MERAKLHTDALPAPSRAGRENTPLGASRQPKPFFVGCIQKKRLQQIQPPHLELRISVRLYHFDHPVACRDGANLARQAHAVQVAEARALRRNEHRAVGKDVNGSQHVRRGVDPASFHLVFFPLPLEVFVHINKYFDKPFPRKSPFA